MERSESLSSTLEQRKPGDINIQRPLISSVGKVHKESNREQLEKAMLSKNLGDLFDGNIALEDLNHGVNKIPETQKTNPTLKQTIENRKITDFKQIRTPGDVSRYIESSGDQAMKDLYDMLGGDNNGGADNIYKLILLTGVGTSIELGKGFADLTKFGEDLLKAGSELLNGNESAMRKIIDLLKALGIEGMRALAILPIGKILKPVFAKIGEQLRKISLGKLEEFLRPLVSERGSITIREGKEIKKLSERKYLGERLEINNVLLKFDENMSIHEFFKYYKDFRVYFNNKVEGLKEGIKIGEDINEGLGDIYENFSNILKYCRNGLTEDIGLIDEKAKSIKNTLLKDNEIGEIMNIINENNAFLVKRSIKIIPENSSLLKRINLIYKTLTK